MSVGGESSDDAPWSGTESQHGDRKSLRVVTGKTADFRELAGDCVCFANAAGGQLHIGISASTPRCWT